ncbi:MAG: response regulator [Candidatus Saganbacteria bacterium]|nr:response regulator [Candidatus Saganbacteria bacterium]
MSEHQERILLIEDEKAMSDAVKLRLEANGFSVLTAYDGQTGLATARKERPDLIILDVMLPKLDGFMVCRMLKFDEKYRNIPVLLLTARTQQTDVQQGEEMGADAYMTKPFKSEELLARIRALLSGENKKAEA